MLTTRRDLLSGCASLALAGAAGSVLMTGSATAATVEHSDAEWRALLTPAQYNVLRQEGTERPYSSPLNDEHRQGMFVCAGCRHEVFASDKKFDSRTGWPSFWAPVPGAVLEHTDKSFGTVRTAINCSRCEGHLGHVFHDGPKPTGLRYCMNGVAMTFRPAAA